jgi:hypothetical protein
MITLGTGYTIHLYYGESSHEFVLSTVEPEKTTRGIRRKNWAEYKYIFSLKLKKNGSLNIKYWKG